MDLRPYYILIGLLLGLLLPYLPRSISYIYSRCRRNDANELYAPTDSLLLNLEEPKTRWMNMGYWRRTESFPEACEALATMIGDRARIPEEGTILDVGYGCGDSILLWTRLYRLKSIVGITSLKSQHSLSLKLVNECDTSIVIDLRQGDGADLSMFDSNHAKFDAVVSVDAAYHFNPRRSFLQAAHGVMKPMGHLSLSDLMLCSNVSWLDRCLLRILMYAAGVPSVNIIQESEYRSQLEAIGYENIIFEDISDDVYPGLLKFIRQRDQSEIAQVLNREWQGMIMYAKVLQWWSRPEKRKLSFVLISARKVNAI